MKIKISYYFVLFLNYDSQEQERRPGFYCIAVSSLAAIFMPTPPSLPKKVVAA